MFYLICSCLFFLACTKNTQVSGRALYKSGSPVKNLTLLLIEFRNKYGKRPYDRKNITATNENGYFNFVYKARTKSTITYYLYLKTDSGGVGFDIKKGTYNDIQLKIGS